VVRVIFDGGTGGFGRAADGERSAPDGKV